MRSSEAYAGQHNSIFGKPAAPFEMVGQADAKQPRRCIFILNWAAAAGITFQEVSGSLGDLGTFLPLVVALSATIGLDLGTTLLFTGLYNVASGLGFRIPMCVQPMKTIAAVALAAPGLSLAEVMSAGLFVSGTMLLLGATRLMDLFNAAVPPSIVRGIQLAVGLALAKKGVSQAFQLGPHSWRPWLGVEGLLLGLLAVVFLLVTTVPAATAAAKQQQQQQQQQSDGCTNEQQDVEQQQLLRGDDALLAGGLHQRDQQQQQQQQCTPCPGLQEAHLDQQPAAASSAAASSAAAAAADGGCCGSSSSSAVPSALLVVLLGMLLTPIAHPSVLSGLSLGPSVPQLSVPSWDQFKSGVLKAGIAQLPLTSLNSVIAVTQLAHQLFPGRAARDGWRWQPGAVAVSVGLMNLVGCWFGAFPCCHGSGGLAAQYKFGARSGAAPVLLGLLKITLALLFGSSLLQLLQHFPGPLLGAMLLMSGLELAAAARKEVDARGYGFMLLTAAAIIGLGDTAVGFAVGLGGYAAVVAYEWARSRARQLWRWQT